MGNIFSASEVVELGILIEKNGRDFYNAVLSQLKDEKSGELFVFLAREEEKHIIKFTQILDSIQKYEPPESYAQEYVAYMRSLADGYVFTRANSGKEIGNKVKSEKEAIDLGLGFEKDSILFYEGMKKAVPDFDLKIIDELIAQEKRHLELLAQLKSSIK